MRKQFGTVVLLTIFSFSINALAQSGSNRGGAADKKKNRPAAEKPTEKPTASETTLTPKSEQNSTENEDRSSQSDVAADVVADDEVLKVDTNLVTIPVQVSDRDGRFIGGLTKADFQIAENGAAQEIAFFAEAETPYTVALVLDTSLSAKFKIGEIQTAAFQFVMGLRPQDKVLVISFNEQVQFLSEPTNDRETLRLAIRKTRFGGGTSLYEAVAQTFGRLKKISGRKAVVLFTDGVDTTSRAASDADNLVEAQEFDALVYPVYYDTFEDVQNQMANPQLPGTNPVPNSPVPLPTQTPTIPGTSFPFPQIPQRRQRDPRTGRNPNDPSGRNYPNDPNNPNAGNFPNDPNNRRDPNDPNYPTNRTDPNVIVGGGSDAAEYRRGKQYLEKLSVYTGGRFYTADSAVGLGRAFDQINQDLRSQYSLGYYPPTPGSFGERRTVKVKVNRKKTAVRHRDGYIVGKKTK